MSYYCGYSPGSYIFRFENPRQSENTFEISDLVQQESGGLGPRQQQYFQQLLDVQKEQWREWNEWNDAELKMEKQEYSRLLSDARSGQWNVVRFGDKRRHDLETRVLEHRPERDRKNFTYCGFVPRHLKEHMARLKEIHRRVLHIIVATLTFVGWPASAGNPDSVANIGPRMNEITPSDLRLIRWYWDLHFPKNQPFPEDLRNVFRESLVMTEFVDLMAMMPFQIAPGLVQLFAMVLQATDMTMEEMVVLEAMRQAETGLNLLLSDFKEDRFFVFQDARIRADNILELHHHFAQESFTIDPNHPRRQYNTTADPDLAEKVQKDCAVLRSINQDWEKDLQHSSLVENAVRQAQSRKRPLDRDQDVAQETQPRTRLFKPSACTQDAAPETQPCSWPFASLSRARDATLETRPRNRLFASLACAQVATQVTQRRNRTFKSLVCANGLFESDPDAEYPETIDPKVLRFDPLLSQNDCAKSKRPRGRPPGRRNDKTIARESKAREKLEAEDSDTSTQ
ncbi:hypothetical protein LEL_08673 [Akanthomyces lecanii RCEF 1005]|uniref:Uncharacterized protein n=1 Tax=Akanthomyces lecanii RCEF 1005 TaxID=1081108 RepID=A0A162MZ37_CORDF|nr:hypothetical protein LEL_08673 [Akanthomyces lecanii RCEF 1005]